MRSLFRISSDNILKKRDESNEDALRERIAKSEIQDGFSVFFV